MRITFSIIFTLSSFICLSQKKTTTIWYSDSYEIHYGNALYKNTTFPTLGMLKFAGIGFSNHDFALTPYRMGSSSFRYSFVIPETIKINDSTSATLSGYNVFFGVGAPFFHRNKIFHLNIYVSPDFGRLKLLSKTLRQKNNYISPTISIQPKIYIKRIAISLIAAYSFDLSKTKWTGVSANEMQISPLNQSRLSLIATLGYRPF